MSAFKLSPKDLMLGGSLVGTLGASSAAAASSGQAGSSISKVVDTVDIANIKLKAVEKYDCVVDAARYLYNHHGHIADNTLGTDTPQKRAKDARGGFRDMLKKAGCEVKLPGITS